MKVSETPKQHIPDLKTALVTKQIFKIYACGIGIAKICDRLSTIAQAYMRLSESGNHAANLI